MRSGASLLNSIGPVWDGNEVWLVLGGGVLFAAFPLVYASLFSGFYLAMMLVLLVMILRTVADRVPQQAARRALAPDWDFVFWITSLGLALLLGVAFGNVISGVPLDARGNIHMSLIDLLTPFALLVGVTTVVMFAMHGAIYLTMKTEGELQCACPPPDSEADGRLLRPEHAGGDRHRAVPAANHPALSHRNLARHLPGRGARGIDRRVVHAAHRA